jgi:hypothetical protein
MNKKDMIGIGILGVIVLIMSLALFGIDFDKNTGFAVETRINIDEEWSIYQNLLVSIQEKNLTRYNSLSYEQIDTLDCSQFGMSEQECWDLLGDFLNLSSLEKENFTNVERDSKQSIISTNLSIYFVNGTGTANKNYIFFVRNNSGSLKVLSLLNRLWSVSDNTKSNEEIEDALRNYSLDSDGDGLTDQEENCNGSSQYDTSCIKTNPILKDTDGDSWWDGIEDVVHIRANDSSDYPFNILCNKNRVCDSNETLLTCPSDCNITRTGSCNNNTVCETGENATNCPNDCYCEIGESRSCGSDIGICQAGLQICSNQSRWSECLANILPVNETCNNLDDDCDGNVDEGFDFNNDTRIDNNETFDYDDDGYFPRRLIMRDMNCTGYNVYDCNDMNSSIHPYAREIINGVDDNCDNETDNNITMINKTYAAERIDLGFLRADGSRVYLRVGDWATFKLNRLSGKIEISDITQTTTSLTVTGVYNGQINTDPQKVITINSSVEFDLNKDGKNDISIKLENIQNMFKSTLLIKPLQELLSPATCNNNSICDSGETETNCPRDCFVIVACNNDGVCDPNEFGTSCADCLVQAPQNTTSQNTNSNNDSNVVLCNNDKVCDPSETSLNCPSDCLQNTKWKNIFIYIGAGLLMITILSGGIIINQKTNPYRINKKLKENIRKAISYGLGINQIQMLLNSKKIKPAIQKKGLKYAADFMALKQAVLFYMAQKHTEKEIKALCKKNKWSRSITNDVFGDIKKQQKTTVQINPAFNQMKQNQKLR